MIKLGFIHKNAFWIITLLSFVAFCCASSAKAQISSTPDPTALTGGPLQRTKITADKTGYTLFNPVPVEQMRLFSTDRPGKTHSSTTVDAGHFQVESDFVNYTYDHNSPHQQTTESFSFGTPILKAGITNWMDIEAGLSLYNRTRVTDRMTGGQTIGNGFGDILIGSKINLFGNDGGRQALALLPFVKLPTAAHNVGNGVTEYSLNIPYMINLDNLWSLTVEPAVGALKNTADNGLHGDYSLLLNINRPIFVNSVTAALEFASEYSGDPRITPRYTLDPSLQWLITPNLQLDVGIYIGLNKAAPDANPYTGISYRY